MRKKFALLKDLSDVMYRLFWYLIFLIIPYIFISFFLMDIFWIKSNFILRMFFWGYSVICFVPCVVLGVYTPKGMRDIK